MGSFAGTLVGIGDAMHQGHLEDTKNALDQKQTIMDLYGKLLQSPEYAPAHEDLLKAYLGLAGTPTDKLPKAIKQYADLNTVLGPSLSRLSAQEQARKNSSQPNMNAQQAPPPPAITNGIGPAPTQGNQGMDSLGPLIQNPPGQQQATPPPIPGMQSGNIGPLSPAQVAAQADAIGAGQGALPGANTVVPPSAAAWTTPPPGVQNPLDGWGPTITAGKLSPSQQFEKDNGARPKATQQPIVAPWTSSGQATLRAWGDENQNISEAQKEWDKRHGEYVAKDSERQQNLREAKGTLAQMGINVDTMDPTQLAQRIATMTPNEQRLFETLATGKPSPRSTRDLVPISEYGLYNPNDQSTISPIGGKPPTEAETPLKEQVPNLNAGIQDRWDVINKGKPRPAWSVLGTDAKTADYNRINSQMSGIEAAQGAQATRVSAQAAQQEARSQRNEGLATSQVAALDRESTKFGNPWNKIVNDSGTVLDKITEAKNLILGDASAQALGLPKVLTALVSGMGSGVRITMPELQMLGHARGIKGDVEGTLRSWAGQGKLDSKQPQQIAGLLDDAARRIAFKQQLASDALDGINSGSSRQEIIAADAKARQSLMSYERGGTAPISAPPGASSTPSAQPHGIPDLGSTFNGGKVLKVEKVK